MLKTKTSWFKIHRKTTVLVAVVVLAAAVFAGLELTDTTHVFNKSGSQNESGNDKSKPNTVKHGLVEGGSGSSAITVNKGGKTPAQNGSPSGPLIAPTGTFVNNYNVSLGEQLTSTCNTTPGANCQITFTRNGVTKSLPAKQADSNGGVLWAWHPNDTDVGLTPGTWHIVAVATRGSESKVTDNGSLELTITQ